NLQTTLKNLYMQCGKLYNYVIFIMILSLFACQSKKPADLFLYNGSIYTVNQNFDVVQAMVIKDGKIIDVGTDEQMQNYDTKMKNGRLTGILIDNAKDSVKKLIPEYTLDYKTEALLKGQKNCFEVGLTTVSDAGLEKEKIEVIDSLQKAAQLKMRVYAMITYDD